MVLYTGRQNCWRSDSKRLNDDIPRMKQYITVIAREKQMFRLLEKLSPQITAAETTVVKPIKKLSKVSQMRSMRKWTGYTAASRTCSDLDATLKDQKVVVKVLKHIVVRSEITTWKSWNMTKKQIPFLKKKDMNISLKLKNQRQRIKPNLILNRQNEVEEKLSLQHRCWSRRWGTA